MQHQKVLFGEVKFDNALACMDALNAHANSTDAVIANLVDKFCTGQKVEVTAEGMNGLLHTLMLNISFIRALGQQLYEHVQELQVKLNHIQSLTNKENEHGE